MENTTSEIILASLIKDAVEAEGCHISGVDLEKLSIEVDGPDEVIRDTSAEKEAQIEQVQALHERQPDAADAALSDLQEAAITNDNCLNKLIEASKICYFGQITH